MIAVEHVTKTYGTFTAVDDVTFTATRRAASRLEPVPHARLGPQVLGA